MVGGVYATSRELGDEENMEVDTGADEDAEGENEPQARAPKIPVDPGRPTKKEIEEHNALHWPFRSWCPHCVRGRAITSPHPRKGGEVERDPLVESGIATVSLDYVL